MFNFWYDADYRNEYLTNIPIEEIPTIEELQNKWEERQELFA